MDRDRLYDVLVSQIAHDDRICSRSLSLSLCVFLSFSLSLSSVSEPVSYHRPWDAAFKRRELRVVYLDQKRPVRPVANLPGPPRQ